MQLRKLPSRQFRAVGALLCCICMSVCAEPDPSLQPVNYSFARPAEAAVRSIDLELVVDFQHRELRGLATLEIEAHGRRLVLDTRDLSIESVTLGKGKNPASYSLGSASPSLGRPLVIDITPETRVVNIRYATSPAAEAIQWIVPGKKDHDRRMCMYTQSEPTLARSWVPCQDNPQVRATLHARIKAPKGMIALMGAANPQRRNASGAYDLTMPLPIPSYLLALAVGDFGFQPTGRRSGVYAEPGIVGRAAYEFADAEKMIAVAESLYGPYRWSRWDVLVLPPSFPLGGMENPRLTFATPTIIVGDRSLVSLTAHELGHSWAGNLVTNATWDDGWLNEGMATYLERRIVEAVEGKDAAEAEAVLGKRDLLATIDSLGKTNPDTRLYEDLKGRDLDVANRDVIYEKGYLFLRTIEEYTGRRRWDAFLRTYFDKFAFQSMTTAEFLKYLRQMLTQKDTLFEDHLQIEAWAYGDGLPSNCPKPHALRLDQVDGQIAAFLQSGKPEQVQAKRWKAAEWVYFLDAVSDSMTAEAMAGFDRTFRLTESPNAEILCPWFEAAVAHHYSQAFPALEQFLLRVGRLKFIEPLYRDLARTPEGLELARRTYSKARPGYHPIAVHTIDSVLQWGR